MIGALMLDVEGTTLTAADEKILQEPQVGGVILFARNVESPKQVRELTDHMRDVRPDIIIGVDQEGGRVRRLRDGFSPLPPMGKLGELFETNPLQALELAEKCGWLMATEVLAVGIDVSFAPVLDIDDVSQVIGDRGFHKHIQGVTALSQAFMHGMKSAGMATTGKHFPGHGSCAPDSHVADAIDDRSLDDILKQDLQPFVRNLHMLDALMPAHVIYPKVDSKPAGFSSVWLQDILRTQFNYDGVLFSDDLSMKAAHTAGGVDARVKAAVTAGCDMALVCNNRESALAGLAALKDLPMPNQDRLGRMRGCIPQWSVDLSATCQRCNTQTAETSQWQDIQKTVSDFCATSTKPVQKDPTAGKKTI